MSPSDAGGAGAGAIEPGVVVVTSPAVHAIADPGDPAAADPSARGPGKDDSGERQEESPGGIGEEGEDDEPLCRYCLGGVEDGELISPCACRGSQKFCHLDCLRRWQRMVLVSQPTHPAFYQDDVRHHRCNVCLTEYTCAPPTRHELMASFTGPEIAALIEPACIIGSHEVFSDELDRMLAALPGPNSRAASSYQHWTRGCFLITAVEVDDGLLRIDLDADGMMLRAVLDRIDGSNTMELQGRRFTLAPRGSLADADPEPAALRAAAAEVELPGELVFETEEGTSCGEDHVCAVNLSRRIEGPLDSHAVEAARAAVCERWPGAAQVHIEHYVGGPCDDDEIVSCIVTGGVGAGAGAQGWTVVRKLEDAIELAHARAIRRSEAEGAVHGGQAVEIHGLRAKPELNGERGIALRFDTGSGRWLVRLRSGEGKKVRPTNLEPVGGGAGGRVLAFWGDARWSRAQLLGEIARGHWGLCRASVSDLIAGSAERWGNLDGRMIFAPETEMTEEFMRDASRAMDAVRGLANQANEEAAGAIDG